MTGIIHRAPNIRLHNIDLSRVTSAQAIEFIISRLLIGQGGWMITVTLDIIRQYNKDPVAQRVCQAATLLVADGMPLIWASWLQGTPLPGRVAGSDLISSLSAAAADRQLSIYLIGGAEGTAAAAAKYLRQRYSDLDIRGTFCPPFRFEQDPDMVAKIVESVVMARPDIIFVG